MSIKGTYRTSVAIIRADEFMKVMRNQALSVDQQPSYVVAAQIAMNQKKISIVKSVYFCGRQGIPQRK